MQAHKGAMGEGAGCAGVLVDMQGDMIDSYHDANKAVLKNTAAPRLGAKKTPKGWVRCLVLKKHRTPLGGW